MNPLSAFCKMDVTNVYLLVLVMNCYLTNAVTCLETNNVKHLFDKMVHDKLTETNSRSFKEFIMLISIFSDLLEMFIAPVSCQIHCFCKVSGLTQK